MLAWLSAWGEVQICIWPSRYHCHSLFLASEKSRLVLVPARPGNPGQSPEIRKMCVCVFKTAKDNLQMTNQTSCGIPFITVSD